MARYERNREKNGIEVYFDGKPSDDVIAELKENRWRWFPAKRCWYTRYSAENEQLAQRLCREVTASRSKPAAGSMNSPQQRNTATKALSNEMIQNLPKSKSKTTVLQLDTNIIERNRVMERSLGIQDIYFYAYKRLDGTVKIIGEVMAPSNIKKSFYFSCVLYDEDNDVIETSENNRYGITRSLKPNAFFDGYPIMFTFGWIKSEIKRIKIVPVTLG